MDDSFGDVSTAREDQRIGMAVPLKSINKFEWHLTSLVMEELTLADAPVPFVEGDGSLENADDYVRRYGRELSLDEVLVVRDLIAEEIVEKYRRQLIIARELGETRRDGGPTIQEYRAACALENIEPLM
jgi:hypothetical protein